MQNVNKELNPELTYRRNKRRCRKPRPGGELIFGNSSVMPHVKSARDQPGRDGRPSHRLRNAGPFHPVNSFRVDRCRLFPLSHKGRVARQSPGVRTIRVARHKPNRFALRACTTFPDISLMWVKLVRRPIEARRGVVQDVRGSRSLRQCLCELRV